MNAFSFFIPPNPFFPTKELAAQPGIGPCPLDFEQHSLDHYKTVAINERPSLFIPPSPFLPLWNQPKSARGPAGNRYLEEGKRLGRIKNVNAFSDVNGNLRFNRFLAFSSLVITLRTQQPWPLHHCGSYWIPLPLQNGASLRGKARFRAERRALLWGRKD